MSKYFREARQESFSMIDETCKKISDKLKASFLPEEVLSHIDEIMDIVESNGTSPLRTSLIQAIEERMEKEVEIENLEGEISNLKESCDEKDREIEQLKSEIAEAA